MSSLQRELELQGGLPGGPGGGAKVKLWGGGCLAVLLSMVFTLQTVKLGGPEGRFSNLVCTLV